MLGSVFLCVWLCLGVSLADVPADEVKALPGLMKQPSFRHFSGYLQASGTRHLHYWFVESSQNPSNDPVVLWLNGGPGCSSVLGLLTENGPFKVLADGKTVDYNPFTWNSIANVLYLEAPAGVGYSYADDKDYAFDDDMVAHDNYLALKDFFQKYPEYKSNEFFITGESYGGIYVPTLSSLVVNDTDFNFQGFGVGNGLSDSVMNENSLLYFGYYHGLIGDVVWNNMLGNCCGGNATRCNFVGAVGQDSCRHAILRAQSAISGSGLNIYNLYGECVNGQGLRYNEQLQTFEFSEFGWPMSANPRVIAQKKMLEKYQASKVMLTPPCINATNTVMYLQQEAVRQALHISPSSLPWTPCSTEVGSHYKNLYSTTKQFYHKVLDAGKRVLVYNGDVDMACNFLGDEWFVDSLNQPKPKERKAWYYIAADGTKQVAGFVKQYERLTFVTVRGSGHMVPTDRPAPALKLFTNFIQNIPY
ncbi:lysosomal protective protein-like [Liolophura sinensis]|uniref:lysosomal protective protein-like n=1 Tax=Liolophura sinensis TaxID=3198878 RepID=UPI00315912AC